MNLRDAADSIPIRSRGPGCTVRRISERLDVDDLLTLSELVNDIRLGQRTSTSVAKALQLMGFEISHNTLARHVRGDCTCRVEDS